MLLAHFCGANALLPRKLFLSLYIEQSRLWNSSVSHVFSEGSLRVFAYLFYHLAHLHAHLHVYVGFFWGWCLRVCRLRSHDICVSQGFFGIVGDRGFLTIGEHAWRRMKTHEEVRRRVQTHGDAWRRMKTHEGVYAHRLRPPIILTTPIGWASSFYKHSPIYCAASLLHSTVRENTALHCYK